MPEQKAPEEKDFHQALRESTAAAHKQLEEIPASKILMSDSLSMPAYLHYLSIMYPVMKEMEDHFFPLLKEIVPGIDARKKVPALTKDIQQLQGDIPADEDHPFGSLLGNKEISTGFALGMMYVTEGSTLGGRFILKNLGQTIGLDENNGASFFAGYGQQTGPLWKSFLDRLVQYAHTQESEDSIMEGANFAFDAIYQYFTNHTQKQQ